MPTTPSFATLTSTPVTWSDGTLFNGFLLLGLVLPTGSGITIAEVDLGGRAPGERIPLFLKVPIVDGVYDNGVGVMYNSSITPPNSKYAAWYYLDGVTPVKVAGPSTLFTVSSATLTPPAQTITITSAGTVAPTPDA